MRYVPLFALMAGLGLASQASAATFQLDLVADGDSRWYEYVSDAYAELGRSFNGNSVMDGFFKISNNGASTLGGGADVFPHEANFANIGTLSFANGTGVGVETLAITGLTMNFSPFVADNDTVTNSGYTTALSNVAGTVTVFNGAVAAIDLTSNITFTYQHNMLGALPYDGTFTMNNGGFDLDVDESITTAFGGVRYAWDVHGSVSNLASIPAVPEPETYAMLLAGLGLIGSVVRRRINQA